MTFVATRGLFWWERRSDEVRYADQLLNPAPPVKLSGAADDLFLANADSCLLYATPTGVFQRCSLSAPADTLISASELARAGITHLAGLAMSPDHVLFVLDGGAAAVYRVNLMRE
jgi:hypothetical protein